MTLQEMADTLGISAFPEELEVIFASLGNDEYFLTAAYVEEYELRYKVFGKYLDTIKEGADALRKDKIRACWARICSEYLKKYTFKRSDALKLEMPESDGTLAGHMLLLFTLVPMIPVMIERYQARGFTEKQIQKHLQNFEIVINRCEILTGKVGMNKMYYSWMLYYLYADIFDHGSFNFEIARFPENTVILRNEESGVCIPVMCTGAFHENGLVLGSAGAENPENSFAADFSEDNISYTGHAVIDGKVCRNLQVFAKSDWKCILRPGDGIVKVHIPAGADLTPENVSKDLEIGLFIAQKKWPEGDIKYLACFSWLLEPELVNILGKDSKISTFTERYLKFPIKSAGLAVYSFVFPGCGRDIQVWPEDTRLRKAIKNIYLNGGFIHEYGGVIVSDK